MKYPILIWNVTWRSMLRRLEAEASDAGWARSKVAELAADLQIKSDRIEGLESELAGLQTNNARLNRDASELRAQRDSLQLSQKQELSELRAQREILRRRVASSDAWLEQLRAQRERVKKQNEALGIRLHQLRAERGALLEQRGHLQRRIELLAQQRAVLIAQRDRTRPKTTSVSNAVGDTRTDFEKWSNPDAFDARWSARTFVVSEIVRRFTAVCEIGCGPHQQLRLLLAPNAKYFPADLVKWTEDTEQCDLNSGLFPVDSLRKSVLCVLLGVLEYVNDISSTITRLAASCPNILLTYHPLDRVKERHQNWRNSLTLADFYMLFADAGLVIDEERWYRDEVIWLISHRPQEG